MYWYTKNINIIKHAVAFITIISLSTVVMSCDSNTTATTKKTEHYFDIPLFFNQEINSLTKLNPLVEKKVSINQDVENKELHISNWSDELLNFSTIYLNKPAYQGSIVKDSINNIVTYTFTTDKYDINKVVVQYENTNPVQINITKRTKNFLYNTEEELVYKKNSSYSIEKKQDVLLLGENKYSIVGLIK